MTLPGWLLPGMAAHPVLTSVKFYMHVPCCLCFLMLVDAHDRYSVRHCVHNGEPWKEMVCAHLSCRLCCEETPLRLGINNYVTHIHHLDFILQFNSILWPEVETHSLNFLFKTLRMYQCVLYTVKCFLIPNQCFLIPNQYWWPCVISLNY